MHLVAQDLDETSKYLHQSHRFLENADPKITPKIAQILVRMIKCFSNNPGDKTHVPEHLFRLIELSRHDEAIIAAVCEDMSFSVDYRNSYVFRMSDKLSNVSYDGIVSRAKSFPFALASSYFSFRLYDTSSPEVVNKDSKQDA